ncbi:MAG: hypothetical protein JSV68_21255 [Anaerolineaceae bacterium]|nr:MAG: hypothetical protein JSV68_21255 [Anaerolineaceae bacterium]
MLHQISIRTLYPLALAEGEGMGTAYEYFAKRLILADWLRSKTKPRRLLIAGLPEKYGTSLDFLQLAADLETAVTIVDERPQALARAAEALDEVKRAGQLQIVEPEFKLVRDIGEFPEIVGNYDLALSCEVLQRIAAARRPRFVDRLMQRTARAAIFVPNNDNPAHTNLSRLSGLRLTELEAVVSQGLDSLEVEAFNTFVRTGYVDMPPFPPGITRSKEQREHASTGTGEALAMWGLGYYARLERWFPNGWRRRKSHIIFAFLDNSQR